ncbi:MAG TPA: hypothetical protein VFJ90_15590 [Candidatus Didemnitutus sp.]|nr:hypothetical protein [Candidatus Didemnitutus sp.]
MATVPEKSSDDFYRVLEAFAKERRDESDHVSAVCFESGNPDWFQLERRISRRQRGREEAPRPMAHR